MKRRWKVFWIICISLVVLGAALCISGAVLGATIAGVREVLGVNPDTWEMRRIQIERENDWEEADEQTGDSSESSSEYADADMEAIEEILSGESIYYEETEESYRTSVDVADIEKLKLEVTHMEVLVRTGSDDSVHVACAMNQDLKKDFSIISKEKAELKIELKNRKDWEKTHFSSWDDIEGVIVIQIPPETKPEEISLEIGAGVLNVENIQTKELEVEVGAGEVTIERFQAEEFQLECGAGEAEIRYGDAKEIQIDCGVGTVTYYASGRKQDYDYDLQCGIGALTVGGDSYSGLGSERKIQNNGNKKMNIECGIGVVDVIFED